MNKNKSITFLFPVIVISTLYIAACSGQNNKLSYQQAFERGQPRVLSELPDIDSWLDDEHYLQWQKGKNYRKSKLMKVNAADGTEQLFIDFSNVTEQFHIGIIRNPWTARSDDYRQFIIASDNDLYLFTADDQTIRPITTDKDKENNPVFSGDGKKIAFTRNRNLYILDLEKKQEKQVTFDGSDVIYNGWASWVYYEEILRRSSNYRAFWWSPDGRMIAFMRFDDSEVPEFPIIHPDGVRDYVELQRYPKAGDPNPKVRLGIYHVETNKTKWVDVDEQVDHYLGWPLWTPDSQRLLFQWINRAQDTIRIYSVDPSSGRTKQIIEEKQQTWVGFFEDVTFVNGSGEFLLRSDRDGWRHLYWYDSDGKLKRKLTDGPWQVQEICHVNQERAEVYFLSNQEHPTEKQLYRINLNARQPQNLSNTSGTHRVQISSQATYVIDRYSNLDYPEKIELYKVPGGLIRVLGDRQNETMMDYDWGKTEIFKIPADEGIELPARWILPPDFDPAKKYPVMFRVYGGPGRKDVANAYPTLAEHYHAQQGIIVIRVDHRGSEHFGKKGQGLMHRQLGKWEMQDLIAAVEWLRRQSFVDPQRIGIRGSSYGGYVSALALTFAAEYFTHGVALLSVTDWRYYDTFYTERYMDQPDENPDGYLSGSVLTYVDQYRGELLIIHGEMDDNVHYQNSAQLILALQKLHKPFELMVYPNQRHGVRGLWRLHVQRTEEDFWQRHFFNRRLDLEEKE